MIEHTHCRAPALPVVCFVLFLAATAATAPATEPDNGGPAKITVDFTRPTSPVNRALFSLVNYQRFTSEAGAVARALFSRIDPAGSMARTEIMIHLMEPANDNNNPAVFDWSRLYTDRMYRFIREDGPAFLGELEENGMRPLALLTYNVEWLGRGGRRNAPPTDPEEWAEFAAAVVETMSAGPGRPRPTGSTAATANIGGEQPLMVEIWNEPSPGGPYWTGSREDYFELFRTTADRLRRDYPGVLVGGPSVLSSDGAFLLEFVQECGEAADFITAHFYNQDPVRMARRISDWAGYIEEQTGRAGTLHITESDNWNLRGREKIDYVLTRQFELIARSSAIGSFHHFSLPYYREAADRVFGLLRPDGRIVGDNYLPYLLFSEFRGDEVEASIEYGGAVIDATGDHRTPLPVYAAASREEASYSTIVYLRDSEVASAELVLRLPEELDRWSLRVDQLGPPFADATPGARPRSAVRGTDFRTVEFRSGAGGGRLDVELDTNAGRAFRVTLRETSEGEVDVVVDRSRSLVTLLNGSDEPARGDLFLLALPSGRRTPIATDVRVPASGRVELETNLATTALEGDSQVSAVFEPASGGEPIIAVPIALH